MNLLISSLKLPLKIITWLLGGKRQKPKRNEREQKQLAHIRNFDSTRLKNRTWQKRLGKYKKKKVKFAKRTKTTIKK